MNPNIKQKVVNSNGIADPAHRYISPKGEISRINPSFVSRYRYEIYCINGDLFEDIERYDSLEEAEARIEALLL